MAEQLQIGDVVRHRDPQGLHCATQVYGAAVVASVSPLVLISDCGDMRWSQMKAADLRVTGRAPIYAWANVVSRLERDGDVAPVIPGIEEQVDRARGIVCDLERLSCRQRGLRSELLTLGTVPSGVKEGD